MVGQERILLLLLGELERLGEHRVLEVLVRLEVELHSERVRLLGAHLHLDVAQVLQDGPVVLLHHHLDEARRLEHLEPELGQAALLLALLLVVRCGRLELLGRAAVLLLDGRRLVLPLGLGLARLVLARDDLLPLGVERLEGARVLALERADLVRELLLGRRDLELQVLESVDALGCRHSFFGLMGLVERLVCEI